MSKLFLMKFNFLRLRQEETDFRKHYKTILIFALLILHILPIWLFTYFPSQDGPAHIYNAYVLKSFHDFEEGKLMRQYYQLNLTLFPNWFTHAFLALCMYVVSPLFAEKILLSLIVTSLPLSLFYFLNAVQKGKDMYGFLGFLFSYHYLLHMGFYSFSMSVSLFFWTLGYFMKHKSEMSFRKIGILNMLCIATYFCHILSYGLLILSLILIYIISFHKKPLRVIEFFFYMLPLLFIMANYLLSNGSTESDPNFSLIQIWERITSHDRWSYLLDTKSLVYFTDSHLIITRLMLFMLGTLLTYTLYIRIRQMEILSQVNLFLPVFIIFTAIYFIMPSSMMSGGWINDRINLFMFPVLLPFLNQDFHRYIRRTLIALMVMFALAHLAISCYYYYPLNNMMQEFTSATKLVQKNKSVLGLFGDRSPNVDNVPTITHEEFVEPFTQITSYYCLENGCVDLVNYEAKYNYFPVNWKEKRPKKIDYVVTWRLGEFQPMEHNLQGHYDMIHSTKNLKLYKYQVERLIKDKDIH